MFRRACISVKSNCKSLCECLGLTSKELAIQPDIWGEGAGRGGGGGGSLIPVNSFDYHGISTCASLLSLSVSLFFFSYSIEADGS